MSSEDLYDDIHTNEELAKLEHEGFEKGKRKGKTMNVPFETIINSLKKQFFDWIVAERLGTVENQKIALADLRNVAGCLFLKVQELESE